MGAGVIPFCVKDEKVLFLFHTTFSGRRAGLLVDFGGGGEASETYRDTAVREFIEETDNGVRFSKRRLLLWVPADELLEIYDSAPERLWKRLRQLQGAPEMIRIIKETLE